MSLSATRLSGTVAPLNADALKRQAFREHSWLLSLSLPALLLVGCIVLAPIAWLFWRSFVGPDGFTLINYERMLDVSYGLTLLTTFELAFLVTGVCLLLGLLILSKRHRVNIRKSRNIYKQGRHGDK